MWNCFCFDSFLLLASSCIASLKDLTHKTVHIFDKLAFSDFLQKNLPPKIINNNYRIAHRSFYKQNVKGFN